MHKRMLAAACARQSASRAQMKSSIEPRERKSMLWAGVLRNNGHWTLRDAICSDDNAYAVAIQIVSTAR
jgi:hypothetical protein